MGYGYDILVNGVAPCIPYSDQEASQINRRLSRIARAANEVAFLVLDI